jgi:hypothetical protein
VAPNLSDLGGWSYGLHPEAPGAIVRTMTRVELPLGHALRLEMADPGSPDVVHVQYYIVTDAGAWALWISCALSQLRDQEALLPEIEPPASE